MTPHPVHFRVERPNELMRLQLLIRVVAFMVLGMVGISFGGVFLFAYLVLPIYAAIRMTSLETARAYVVEDAPRVRRLLHWFASISAWAGLVTDELPARQPDETVTLSIDATASQPTPGGALLRILLGLPSALVLAFLCWIGVLVWIWAALSILFVRRIGPNAFGYLVGLQRWAVRLLAYQAYLVDDYPPFSFRDTGPPLPEARAVAH